MKKVSKKVAKKISKLPILIIILLIILGLVFYFLIYPNMDKILAALMPNENQTTTIANPTTTTRVHSGESYDNGIKYAGDNVKLCDDGYVEDAIYENFEIHFMELGNEYAGDSTYIKAGDIDIIIDAGSRQNSAPTICEYVNQYCTDGIIEYVIATHAHQDHIAGFVGTKKKTTTPFGYDSERTGLLYYYKVGTIIDFALTDISTTTEKGNNTLYGDYCDAVAYAVSKGAVHYTAAQCFNEEDGAKKHYSLSETLNISFDVIYNKYYFYRDRDMGKNKDTDENNYSVCTMFNYGDLHFLLTGDLEEEGEEYMAEYYDGSSIEKTLPEVELFKAGHHGSNTSSNDCLLNKIKPKICCVCCCAGCNEYTPNLDNIFPTQAFINRIAKHTDRVYVTSMLNNAETISQGKNVFESMNGNICISSNGDYIAIYASNNLTKLKDTDWFNEEVYLILDKGIYKVSEKKQSSYYSSTTEGAVKRVRRTWP
ncbi:MBL fold metallo-hydrolase [bacterium]|nr:MBL fold metallo-hydrolase [bacterium]